MSNEWYTPAKYIEAARSVMGSIDLDPASCELANQTVRAARYYTQEENGFAQAWYGNVWLNPPYGKTRNHSNTGMFIHRLLDEYRVGNVQQGIILTTTKNTCAWFQPLWDYPICFVDHYIKFHRPGNLIKDQMFGTVFVYLGDSEQAFIDVFSKFGRIAKAIDTPVARPRQLELVS